MIFRSIRWILGFLRETYQVGRPATGLASSACYLYNNQEATLLMSLYFAFIFQIAANAANDYMDWERDEADKRRDINISRGKARNKNFAWIHYAYTTVIAFAIGYYYDQLFFWQYLFAEFAGNWLYNGLLLGIPVNKVSMAKKYGFPLDVLMYSMFMAFPNWVTMRRFCPSLTMSAWGVTMVWAQMKDYPFEKNTGIRTTPVVLGPTPCRVIISVAALVMTYGDWRFSSYGAYVLYRCWYPVLKEKDEDNRHLVKVYGRVSGAMALNLFYIVCMDSNVDPYIKFTTFGLQILAYLCYKVKLYASLEQKYFAIAGILNRHRPYDPTVWEETDPDVLLWRVGSQVGRSFSAIMGFFGIDFAKGGLLAFVYFRVLDTWADVAIGSKARIQGLGLLPKRLKALDQQVPGVMGVPDTEECDQTEWDLNASRPRNRAYVDVTKNVHRFDEVFVSLPRYHKDILLEFTSALGEGWAELERRKDEPVTPELMRRHAEVAIDAGWYGMCKAMAAPGLYESIHPNSSHVDLKASAAWISFSDFIWYMNLVADIEEDVEEGVALDEDLRAMEGIQTDVIDRVRTKWMIIALKGLTQSRAFLFHPDLENSWMLRMTVLQGIRASIDAVCTKYLMEANGAKEGAGKVNGAKMTFQVLIKSLSIDSYHTGVQDALEKSDHLLRQFVAIQARSESNTAANGGK